MNIKKREESIHSMIEQCCGIIVITGALLCAVLFKYQLWLDEMANGSKPIRGINASMNLYHGTQRRNELWRRFVQRNVGCWRWTNCCEKAVAKR